MSSELHALQLHEKLNGIMGKQDEILTNQAVILARLEGIAIDLDQAKDESEVTDE